MNTDIIQEARDVLAKWRKAARDGEWSIEADTAESSWLGRGTAGNPELLDAIDGMLSTWSEAEFVSADLSHHIKTTAGAIIAADKRMNA